MRGTLHGTITRVLDDGGVIWKPAEDALLGTDTDRAMVHKLGRNHSALAARRLKLGIPPYARRRPITVCPQRSTPATAKK